MDKKNYIETMNSIIKGDSTNLLLLISDYLTEVKPAHRTEIISLIAQHPSLINHALSKVIEYYDRKYNICKLLDKNKEIILYRE